MTDQTEIDWIHKVTCFGFWKGCGVIIHPEDDFQQKGKVRFLRKQNNNSIFSRNICYANTISGIEITVFLAVCHLERWIVTCEYCQELC